MQTLRKFPSESDLSDDFGRIISAFEHLGSHSIKHPGSGFNLFFPSDSKSIFFHSDENLVIVDKIKKEVVKNIKLIPRGPKAPYNGIKSISYSEHNSLIFLGDFRGIIHCFHSVSFAQQHTLTVHEGSVNKLKLSFDEILLYSCGEDSRLKVTDLVNFTHKTLYTHDDEPIRYFEISPDGEFIASVGPRIMKVYSIMDEIVTNVVELREQIIVTLRFSPNREFLATGDTSGRVQFWDCENYECTDFGTHEKEIVKLLFHKNCLISAGADNLIKIWSIGLLNRPIIIRCEDRAFDMQVDEENLYYVCSNMLHFLRVPENNPELIVKSSLNKIRDLLYSSKHKLIIASAGGHKNVIVFSSESFEKIQEIVLEESISAICLSCDQKFLFVSVEKMNIVYKYYIEDNFAKEVFIDEGIPIPNICCSPDSKYLIILEVTSKCIIKDISNGKTFWTFSDSPSPGSGLCTGHLSNQLFTVTNNTILVYDLTEVKHVGKMFGFDEQISRVRVSRDDRYLAFTTRQTGFLYIWHIQKMALVKKILLSREKSSDLYFTLNNQHLIVASSDTKGSEIYFFELQSLNLVTSLTFPKAISGFTLIADDQKIVIDQCGSLLIKDNPLKYQTFSVVGPDYYPTNYIHYLIKISKAEHTDHDESMDKYAIFPENINTLHFYAYYNLVGHLKNSLHHNSGILTSVNGFDILNISLAKGYTDCVKIILQHVVKRIPDDPYIAIFISKSINELNLQSLNELSEFYNAIFYKSNDSSLPRFGTQTDGFCKSEYVEILPFTLVESQKSGKAIVFYQSGISLDTELGSKDSIQFMTSILATGNTDIFRSEYISQILTNKWADVKGFAYFLSVFYLVYLIVLSLHTLSQENEYYYVIVIIQNVILFIFEMYQVILSHGKYFKDTWNVIDILRTLFFILYFSTSNYSETFLFFFNFFSWFKGISYFRIFSSTRYLIGLIIEVFIDSAAFLVMLCYFTLAFTFLTLSITPGNTYASIEEYQNIYLLNYGQFPTVQGNLNWICFIIASLVNFLFMTNLMISIIGDTYSKVQSDKDITDRIELTQMILEIESIMYWKRESTLKTYIQVVKAESDDSNGDEWQGKIVAIEKQIKKIEKSIQASQVEISKKFDSVQDGINCLNQKIEKFIESKA